MTTQSHRLIPVTKDPDNAETPLSALLNDITPLDLVYIRNHFAVPQIDVNAWTLDVFVSGENSASLSYPELQELPTKTLTITLECAGNGRKSMDPVPKGTAWNYGAISIVEFTGTPLQNVLQKIGVPNDTVEIAFHGADQGEVEPGRNEKYSRSLPLEVALDPNTLLAWEMNQQPLPPQHGYPLRLVVPNWYGMASVKWLKKIEFLSKPFKGFFQNEHYIYVDEEGVEQNSPVRNIRPRSLVIKPGDGTQLSQGETELTGIAWSGYGAISQVEVSMDGGNTWSTAELDSPPAEYDVQKWRCKWTPEAAGNYKLISRARDSMGHTQPLLQRQNHLGYGNNGPHSVTISVI
jgi:DMSO/TMAO reductase YedYZ molybdopterin-dependent catalytic subunit